MKKDLSCRSCLRLQTLLQPTFRQRKYLIQKDYISVLVLQISSLLYYIRIFLQRGSQLFWCNTIREWYIRSYALCVMCLPKSKFLLALRRRYLESSASLFPTVFPPLAPCIGSTVVSTEKRYISDTEQKNLITRRSYMLHSTDLNYNRSVVVNENVGVTSAEQPKLRNLVLFT